MPNYVRNILTVSGNEGKAMLNRLIKEVDGEPCLDFNEIIPMPEHIFCGNLGQEERAKYGDANWYDWSISNWGTKWNSSGGKWEDENTFAFDTAWSAPIPVLKALAKQNPDVSFTLTYADEDAGHNAGVVCYDGETAEWGETDMDNTSDALALYIKCWGEDDDRFAQDEQGNWYELEEE